MRQPNTYHIREFINSGNNITNKGLLLDKDSVINITKELADLLSYTMQLENKIVELQENLSKNESIQVEMMGKDF